MKSGALAAIIILVVLVVAAVVTIVLLVTSKSDDEDVNVFAADECQAFRVRLTLTTLAGVVTNFDLDRKSCEPGECVFVSPDLTVTVNRALCEDEPTGLSIFTPLSLLTVTPTGREDSVYYRVGGVECNKVIDFNQDTLFYAINANCDTAKLVPI